MVFPYGAVVSAAKLINDNRNNDNDSNMVKDIVVKYEDGSCKTIQHGVTAEVVDDDTIILDYANCTNDQFLTILRGLIKVAVDKGFIDML